MIETFEDMNNAIVRLSHEVEFLRNQVAALKWYKEMYEEYYEREQEELMEWENEREWEDYLFSLEWANGGGEDDNT